ncbi:MAG: hypothetical protein BM557_03320 [Flavobacterium sp. MedPE-SWcel]|uniref:OsmC family protein n=1 Tax=uncultured Flavobacterium sp. TaxID=165435 RepID=UPI00092360FC|nr:OsmC family protein [uncultured Flavobacterium sp.]OIQ21295.1 MAG: hypothetical protein BM557_03320 [Flavobacterium sp. MedPE-SWcel]
MNTQPINVLGYTSNNQQFVVKTLSTNLKVSQNDNYLESKTPNPYEYILAGFAAYINALGILVAQELAVQLYSLQIEITGNLNDDVLLAKSNSGFKNITIKLKPATDVPMEALQKWLEEIKSRNPTSHLLGSNAPVNLVLFKKFACN